jgi:hypothetical protein
MALQRSLPQWQLLTGAILVGSPEQWTPTTSLSQRPHSGLQNQPLIVPKVIKFIGPSNDDWPLTRGNFFFVCNKHDHSLFNTKFYSPLFDLFHCQIDSFLSVFHCLSKLLISCKLGPIISKSLAMGFVYLSFLSSLFMAQFQTQEGLSSPTWGEPMMRIGTTILSDKVQEHLLFVSYWLYMLHTFCLTPCFLKALIIADGLMLMKASLMSSRVATTNYLSCRPFSILFT